MAVLTKNNRNKRMIKPTELKVGAVVKYKGKEYTIKEINAKAKMYFNWRDCIIYAPNYKNDCNLFVRDSNYFIKNFEIVKQ